MARTAAPQHHLSTRGRGFHLAARQLVRRGLRGVWVQGAVPSEPLIWATNHHHWWDAFVAGAVLDPIKRPTTIMVSAENLATFSALSWIGAIPNDEPLRARTALAEGWSLVIMPEGQMRGPGPLWPLKPGAEWLARRTGRPMMAAATRVVVRGHQHPEAYVILRGPVEPGRLEVELAQGLLDLDRLISESDPDVPLPGFTLAATGRASSQDTALGGLALGRKHK